jgi:hypothetical protein
LPPQLRKWTSSPSKNSRKQTGQDSPAMLTAVLDMLLVVGFLWLVFLFNVQFFCRCRVAFDARDARERVVCIVLRVMRANGWMGDVPVCPCPCLRVRACMPVPVRKKIAR